MTHKFKNFISPHVHVDSLDSASTPDDFLKRELELDTGAFVCTDHGFMGSCREVYKLSKKNKIIPILGIEAYHRDDNCSILKNAGIQNISEYYKYGHFLIHTKDQKAYEALVKKISDRDLTAESHGSERKPIFNWGDIEELAQYNTTFSSGCLIGIVSRHLMNDRPDLAQQYYEKMRNIVGKDKFIVEMFPHKCDKNWVSGTFLTLEDGTVVKYYLGKKVRTNYHDEITVAELASVFKKFSNIKLLAIKNHQSWQTLEGKEIIKAERIQDFISNECRPWCPDGDVQLGANKFIFELAKKHNDLILVSDDAHYATSDLKIVQEAKLGGMGANFKFYGDYHRQTSEEAFAYFKNNMGWSEKQFEEAVENSKNWAQGFKDFKLDQPTSLPKSFYPSDTKKYLFELIEKHGRRRNTTSYESRLNEEIKLLHENGTIDLLPYFFLAEDMCDEYARNKRLNGPGRGSSAGLLINYYLGITHTDPMKHDLSLDRFLTLDRVKTGKLPDVDLDFPTNEILVNPEGFLPRKFGPNFAQISTKGLLRVKSAIKDVARYKLGSVTPEIEKICNQIPSTPQGIEDLNFLFGYKSEDGKEVKGFFEQSEALQFYSEKYKDHWEIVLKALKIKRNNGRHASGFLIADKPLDSFIPLMTVGGVRCTQYNATGCEESGALKIDILTVSALKDIENCIKIIHESKGFKPTEDFFMINDIRVPSYRVVPFENGIYDIWDLPDSAKVFNEIAKGRTETVFQMGTNSAKKGLKTFNIFDSKEDGAAFIALDRPGPLDAKVKGSNGAERNMLEEFASRAKGLPKYGEILYLSEALPKTHGVIVYQEDLTKIYKLLTDCSGIDAENFRSIISKKKMEEVLAKYPFFMKNASEKVGQETAQAIWDQIYTFGQYGFNKSHAMCYFYISYATAFLKKHFPLEWWCAVLQNAKKEEIVEKFWAYCKDMVILPDIRYSKDNFFIKDNKIIAPLGLIKGLGPAAQKEIDENSPYKDLADFCNKIANTKTKNITTGEDGKVKAGRSSLNNGVTSKLIISGVMDSLFPDQHDLLSKLEKFQEQLAISLNKKRPEKVKEEFQVLNPIQIYQYRKKLLEVYSDFIPELTNIEGVHKKSAGRANFYTYHPINSPKVISSIFEQSETRKLFQPLPVLNGKQFIQLNSETSLYEGEVLKVAVVAYVEEERNFQFKKKGTDLLLKAKNYKLDIDGAVAEVVKWPEYKTNKLNCVKEDLTGCIVVAVLTKNKETQPFKLSSIIKVANKLED